MEQAASDEIRSLTAARGIFSTAVLAFHLGPHAIVLFPLLAVAHPVLDVGWLGVDAFFILSGFVLAHRYAGRLHGAGDYARFLWLRVCRIYPLYLASTLLAGLAVGVALLIGISVPSASSFTLDSFLRNLLMVQSWPGLGSTSWNVPAWSVSWEWLLYILFPIVGWLATRKLPATAKAAAALALLALPAVLLHAHPGHGEAYARVVPAFAAGALLQQARAA
ncbi:MAG TPA: acyltransferase, partial [Candidatus Thermoplasmatota archaeon]|nr:acyltransferase [Candidatus Thermoplasmatota archaeon]